jgi:hypothetical protein
MNSDNVVTIVNLAKLILYVFKTCEQLVSLLYLYYGPEAFCTRDEYNLKLEHCAFLFLVGKGNNL